jgi:hypothetical protein
VDAYRTGVVFDEQHIRRILNTNLAVMWNGSFDAPSFCNSNANANQKAGVLRTPLADFRGHHPASWSGHRRSHHRASSAGT